MAADIPSYGGVIIAGDDYELGQVASRFAGEIVANEVGGAAGVVILTFPGSRASFVEPTASGTGWKRSPRETVVVPPGAVVTGPRWRGAEGASFPDVLQRHDRRV